MENNQDDLRERVLRRCTPQKVAAKEIGLSKEYFNTWIKDKKNLSTKAIEKVESWLKNT